MKSPKEDSFYINTSRLRVGMIIFAFLIIIRQLIIMDYNNMVWENNAFDYWTIITMLSIILLMLLLSLFDKYF